MSTRLAQRLDVVKPSATLAVSARAAALRAEGRTIYPFGVGEPDFDTPVHVRDAAKAALDAGATRYTAVSGTLELRKAIAAQSTRTRGVPCKPDQVVVSVGAKHALFNLAIALYEPGDEVIIPAPYWVSYPEQVRLVGATPVVIETTEADGFLLRPEALAAALTPKTKAVILCTPSNPTGGAYPREWLQKIVDVMAQHDAFLIVDEIYASLVYDAFEQVSALTLASEAARDRIIVIDGVSKTYAMTGWRIGWSITTAAIAKALDVVQSQSTTNPTALAQAATIVALDGPQDSVRAMRDRFATRRTLMVETLRTIPGVSCRMPEGAFYAFADVRGLYGLPWAKARSGKLDGDLEVATFLLEEAGCAAVPGSAFGAPGYLRFSYATSEQNIEAGLAAAKAAVLKARG
ncbi:MAG: pyridoxal phosphate-dependent aminotransferase [Myxococcales bacterium]|nr:pyridoxal phosphate-dependent aminotransferase [Myxococcales bacterium]